MRTASSFAISRTIRLRRVSPALADALRQFQDAAPGATLAERTRQYLLHLCIDPDFHQWQQRYAALSGGYSTAPELTPTYSAILVHGEGHQRQIERLPLPDIRTALENHAVFILLAQGVAETPQDFLARMWRERMPSGSTPAQDELQTALRQGQL